MGVLALTFDFLLSQWVWPILAFVVGLGLVVFVHEFGHFLAAKWAGIRVDEFALGFGKRLWGVKRGDTDYRINVLPLGGYVKMLGQDDFDPAAGEQADPRSWGQAKPYRRFVVLAAGVTMNVIFAALIFVGVYMAGIKFTAPIVGGVREGFPAATAALPPAVAQASPKPVGLAAGDRILAINGRAVRKFDQVMLAAALSGKDESFDFRVERQLQAGSVQFDVHMTPKRADGEIEGIKYALGIELPASTIVSEQAQDIPPMYYAGKEHFQKGDRIVAADDHQITHYWDLEPLTKIVSDQALKVTVARGDNKVIVPVTGVLLDKLPEDSRPEGQPVTRPAASASQPAAGAATKPGAAASGTSDDDREQLTILGMSPRVLVGLAPAGTPAAKSGLEAGDLIVAYGDTDDPSYRTVTQTSRQMLGQATALTVLRQGKPVTLTVKPFESDGKAIIGFASTPERGPVFVAAVANDSPAARAGIVPGSVITKVDEQPVPTWISFYQALLDRQGRPVTLTVRLGELERTVPLGTLNRDVFDKAKYEFLRPALNLGLTEPLRTDPIRGGPLQALTWSAQDTGQMITQSYLTLSRLFERRIGAKSVTGPLGIGNAAVQIARRDPTSFVYFIGMLSAILAVMNFLPLPALDGGHVVFLLIEKLRGRPLPMKVQIGFQVAGLVFFLLVFVAATFNDILRMLPK